MAGVTVKSAIDDLECEDSRKNYDSADMSSGRRKMASTSFSAQPTRLSDIPYL
jgi:hypothetical protein